MTPPRSPEEEAHARAVAALIRERIHEAGGWLSFERFMDLALYAPGLGYYSAGSVKLGPGGDFVTAPEVSDLFSRCVARQCAQVLERGGEILELGAGTGRMAAIILETLAAGGALPERYAILEVSADLAERQRRRLERLAPELRERVVWLERLPERPIRGVILANEVLDALPCRRFTLSEGQVRELGVAAQGNPPLIIERQGMPDEALRSAVSSLLGELPQPLPEGYTSELCLRVSPWIGGMGACLERGLLLLLDYGLPRSHYYHPQRTSGTLRCHFRHRVHDDPTINIGLQDITAWVDFTRVAEAAVDCGLEVSGFATQAAFLLALGIEQDVAAVTDPLARARLAGEAQRLLLPGEMGEAFKVMALARGLDQELRGFSLQDLRRSL
ncbi:MAG TPA: SAM-dependent methyltransferase [Steroidobacteraceae bacterium]|nr:SAM-dependent methyltransferase [Steroidobacteraceae bacterium]